MISFKEFLNEQYLIEAKIDDYKAQEKSIPVDHDPNATFTKPHEIIDHFHSFIPGGNIDHTRWVVNRYKAKELKQDDAPSIGNAIDAFNRYKDRLPKKNIHQYKSVEELRDALHPFIDAEEKRKKISQEKIAKGSTLIHDSDKVKMWHVHNMEASQELGHPSWCTTNPDPSHNMFNHYNANSDKRAYIIHLPKEQHPYRKIGIFAGTQEFQDENNKFGGIEHKDLEALVKRNPELKKIPELQGIRTAVTEHPEDHIRTLINSDPEGLKTTNISPEKLREMAQIGKERIKIGTAADRLRRFAVSHPNFDSDDLHKVLSDPNVNIETNQLALKNKNIRSEHLDTVLNQEFQFTPLLAEIANHPQATSEQLEKLVDHKKDEVAIPAAANPNMDRNRLSKILRGPYSDELKIAAFRNPSSRQEDLHHYLLNHKENDEFGLNDIFNVKGSIIEERHDLHPDTLHDLMLSDNQPKGVKEAVIRHPNVRPETLDHAVSTDDKDLALGALENKKIHPDTLFKALDSSHTEVAEKAAEHKNATPEVVDKALQHHDVGVAYRAMRNPNIDPERINELIEKPDSRLPHTLNSIISNPSLTTKHIDKLMKKTDGFEKSKLIEHPNATSEHIDSAVEDENKNVAWTAAHNRKITDKGRRIALNRGLYDKTDVDNLKNGFITGHLASTDKNDFDGAAHLAKHITKPQHFTVAINHPDPTVRGALATNQNLPSTMRKTLLNDPVESVRNTARIFE